MTRRRLERLLWVLALAVLLLGRQRSRPADPAVEAPSGVLAMAPAEPRRVPPEKLQAAARAAAEGNLFRLDRAPAPIGFNQTPPLGMVSGGIRAYAPPSPPAQQLTVTGIVGPPWQALLEGVPGREGTAVAVKRGDVLDGLRIRDVSRTSVIVSSNDTTWRLNVRRPWQ